MTAKGLATLVLAAVSLAAGASAADRYDPRLRFRTLPTARFDIHYHQGEEQLARRVAALAEAIARELEPAFGRPRQRVQVILVGQDDPSNGWATPVPFNVIEITVSVPRGASVIGNTNDWLRLVFVHEYTHILHLDRSRGVFGGLRRVFGRHPLLLPNLFVPPWQIEGLATHVESRATGEGRVPAGDFRLMLDAAALSGRLASLDRASNQRIAWPSGHTPYLYGAYFHEYLAETYGAASLARLADATAGRAPYLSSGAFRKVFGKSLGEAWHEFERYTEQEATGRPSAATRSAASRSAASRSAASRSAASRLTRHGFTVTAPAYSSDGRLFYSVANPDGFPSLMELEAGGTARAVTTRVGGERTAPTPKEIVFDQLEYVRSVGVQSDLYAVSRDSGRVRRLTRQARAGDPDLSPDGRTLVLTMQEVDRRSLATLTSDGSASPSVLASEPGTHFASPRWSPDGRTIAAERRLAGGPSDIVLLDAQSGALLRTLATSTRGRNIEPSWSPDGRTLLFASDRDGGPFQVYVTEVATSAVQRLANAGDTARSPVRSPDGATLVFVGYTADGYDLFAMPWAEAEWAAVVSGEPAAPGTLQPRPDAADHEGVAATVAYRPFRMLHPRFWTPIVEPDGDDTSVGAATSGTDALGRHAYAIGAAWARRGRPDWYAGYQYDRWRPTVYASVSDDTEPWLAGTIRTREINAGVTLAFRTFRRTQSAFTGLHVSADRVDCAACAPAVHRTVDRRAVRAGWTLRTSKEFGYSISPERGLTMSASGEWAPRALGSNAGSRSAVIDVRGYAPAVPRHGVIALRVAGAASWGDERATRLFGAGGAGPRLAGPSFDRDAVALVRGFDTDDSSGARVVVVNADYRVPLAWVERGPGTWPVFLRSLHAAIFADGGAAWNQRLTRQARRASMGLELSTDVVIAHAVPLTIASGVAWRHDPTGTVRGAAVFARVGRAF